VFWVKKDPRPDHLLKGRTPRSDFTVTKKPTNPPSKLKNGEISHVGWQGRTTNLVEDVVRKKGRN